MQTNCTTSLVVIGKVRVSLSRSNKKLMLDLLVVEDLDVDVLARIQILIRNCISGSPATKQITIHGYDTTRYTTKDKCDIVLHAMHAATSHLLRVSPTTVL